MIRRPDLRKRIRSERGEVSSWLILAAGLTAAALAASITINTSVAGLAGQVGNSDAVAMPEGSGEPVAGDLGGTLGKLWKKIFGGGVVVAPSRPHPNVAHLYNPDGTFVDPVFESTFGDMANLIGPDAVMTTAELDAFSRLLIGLTPMERALALFRLNDAQLARLFNNVHDDSLWTDAERTALYDSMSILTTPDKARLGNHSPFMKGLASAEQATVGDPGASAALNSLLRAPTMRAGLTFDERAAVLAAVGVYPDNRAITNLERMTNKTWFTDMNLDDTQRTARTIAALTEHEDSDLINNTLDQFIGAGSTFELKWDDLGGPYGTAGGGVLTLGREFLAAGDGIVDFTDPNTIHMVTHTVAHEVNHLVNGDTVSATYDYFMGEYRAYYVGQTARFGRPPTAAEVRQRVQAFVNPLSGTYTILSTALADPVEGPRILAFVSQLTGTPVTAATVVAELNALASPGVDAPVPVSVDGGPNNLDNS